ncbi:MAG TPA: hypothetical protein VM434_12395 [Beijerinckiaceae bacterium]|nr:hypothetical protein [Beijerinckiaceae bacterium]
MTSPPDARASAPDEQATNGAGPAFPPGDAAEYIAQMSGELAALARSANLELVAYLLAMARTEAAAEAKRNRRPR